MSKLWYKEPAIRWNETLPIGNGRLGASVYGGGFTEKIRINEETLWTGMPNRDICVQSRENIEAVRKLIAERKYNEVWQSYASKLPGISNCAYLVFGDLEFELIYTYMHKSCVYRRELDLDTGISAVNYTLMHEMNAIGYKVEHFVSFADDVLVVHLESEHKLHEYTARINPIIKANVEIDNDTIIARGKCPVSGNRQQQVLVYDDEVETVKFCGKMKLITNGGITDQGTLLYVRSTGDITAVFSLGTSFNGFDKMPISEGLDAEVECDRRLNNALKYSYEELKARHIEAYKREFNTASVEFFGDDNLELLSTDERIYRMGAGANDPALVTTLYDYGRYLLLSSSRKGTQPATLQGIWTDRMLSPWYSNYTMNINTQMNYWAAEQSGLADCHLPLMLMLKELASRKNNYGYSGWYSCNSSDLWRFNVEVECGATFSPWYMSGVWFCHHIYEHFMYTMDKDFLREWWSVLSGAADFLEDFMMEKNGYLTTSPSMSPENIFRFNGYNCAITEGVAMDLSLAYGLYKDMAELAPYIGIDPMPYIVKMKKIKPLGIASDGRLMEWNEEFEESDKGHRHISHLVGYFPLANYGEDSPYYEATKKSLECRLANGGGGTGWSNAWIANMYVRMCDRAKSYEYLARMFRRSMYPNMTDAHSPFQIDGNFGILSAISEMLVQSHRGYIDIIPALPKELANVKVRGIKARGAYTVNFDVVNGIVENLEIIDKNGNECSQKLIADEKVKIHNIE